MTKENDERLVAAAIDYAGGPEEKATIEAFLAGAYFLEELYKEPIQKFKDNFEQYQELFKELKGRVEKMEAEKNDSL